MFRATALNGRIPGYWKQNDGGHAFHQSFSLISKNKDTRCRILGNFEIPNTIQLRKYLRGGGIDNILHIGSGWRNPDGNLNVAYLNWNGGQWVLSFNWLENDWNSNDRLPRPRNFLYFSPPKAGFSLLSCLFHPPSILPISSSFSESSINFLLSSDFISQATWRKNLSTSSFISPFLR